MKIWKNIRFSLVFHWFSIENWRMPLAKPWFLEKPSIFFFFLAKLLAGRLEQGSPSPACQTPLLIPAHLGHPAQPWAAGAGEHSPGLPPAGVGLEPRSQPASPFLRKSMILIRNPKINWKTLGRRGLQKGKPRRPSVFQWIAYVRIRCRCVNLKDIR